MDAGPVAAVPGQRPRARPSRYLSPDPRARNVLVAAARCQQAHQRASPRRNDEPGAPVYARRVDPAPNRAQRRCGVSACCRFLRAPPCRQAGRRDASPASASVRAPMTDGCPWPWRARRCRGASAQLWRSRSCPNSIHDRLLPVVARGVVRWKRRAGRGSRRASGALRR